MYWLANQLNLDVLVLNSLQRYEKLENNNKQNTRQRTDADYV